MIKKLFCTIDLEFGKIGQVFGYYRESTVIEIEKGKLRGLKKTPEYLEYDGEKGEVKNSRLILEDKKEFTVIKMFSKND